MEELQLVQMLKSGSTQAFDTLYHNYVNQAVKTAYLLAGNQQDSEDIVQETFIKVYLNIHKLKNPEGFRSWFYQILTRTAWKILRKKAKEIPDEEIMAKADYAENSRQQDTLESCILAEEANRIVCAVQKLEKKQAATVVLYYYNCFSTKEIASVMKCSEGTVKSRLFHARKKLKESLSAEEKEAYFHEKTRSFGASNQ